MFANIETKVVTATAGAGAGAIVGQFVLWVLGVTFWHQSGDAAHATQAIEAVVPPVSALIGLGITVAGAFLGGYVAPHTSRPDLHATPIDQLVRSQVLTSAPVVDAPTVTPAVTPEATPAVTPDVTPAAAPDATA